MNAASECLVKNEWLSSMRKIKNSAVSELLAVEFLAFAFNHRDSCMDMQIA